MNFHEELFQLNAMSMQNLYLYPLQLYHMISLILAQSINLGS